MTTTTEATRETMTPDTFERCVLETTRGVFSRQHTGLDADMPAHALILGADGTLTFLYVAMLMTPQEKRSVPAIIAAHAQKAGAVAVSFISETWTLRSWPPGKPRPLDFSTHPDRVEALMVSIERWGDKPRLFEAKIERGEKGRMLGPWAEPLDDVSGSFVGLLPQPRAQA